MKIKNIFAIAFVGASLLFTACEKDESSNSKLPFDLTQGVVITNEGNMGHSNASISLYYADGDSVANDVFKRANNRVLGDVLQSMAVAGDKVYLILNASNKIEVVEKASCKELATIEGFEGPRYMVINGSKGYVSCWKNGEVAVVDLNTNTITKKVKVGVGPEAVKVVGNKLFVTNSGGWGVDKTVSVIDLTTETVIKTIDVKDCPRDIVVDKTGNLWVLCAGSVLYDASFNVVGNTTSALCKIDPSTYTVTTLTISEAIHPVQLRINGNGDNLFYGADFGSKGIFKMSITATATPTVAFIDDYFYGFTVDPSNDFVFGMQSPSFSAAGKMKRFDTSGKLIKEYGVGMIPNNGYFVK